MSARGVLGGAAHFLRLYQSQVLPAPGAAQRLQQLASRRLGEDRPRIIPQHLFPGSYRGWCLNLSELARELALMDAAELAEATKSGQPRPAPRLHACPGRQLRPQSVPAEAAGRLEGSP
jgi:hypothetical protein